MLALNPEEFLLLKGNVKTNCSFRDQIIQFKCANKTVFIDSFIFFLNLFTAKFHGQKVSSTLEMLSANVLRNYIAIQVKALTMI